MSSVLVKHKIHIRVYWIFAKEQQNYSFVEDIDCINNNI